MKTICDNWADRLSAVADGKRLFPEFQTRATAVAGEVIHVTSDQEAVQAVKDLITSLQAKKIVAVECPLQRSAGLHAAIAAMDVELYTDKAAIAAHAETADIGISGVEFGIAETGSVCQDAYAVESRLVSTLTPIHVVFLDSSRIVPGVAEAFEVISPAFNQGYLSFITGPSRTADIERVLTIGVHGPSRFIIIAIDKQSNGGGR